MKFRVSKVFALFIMLFGFAFSAQSASNQDTWLCQWLKAECDAGDQSKCQYYYSQCMSFTAPSQTVEQHYFRD